MDALDKLRYACEARTILERAGRHDLAEHAWGKLCPAGVPLRVRHDALVQAGYPFRAQREETADVIWRANHG